ncbi:MAG: isoleucine--tRNA ligase [Candidatus Eisenbacteria bacterium]|uniref:Isoleucine--tRNA ligase n=1 Tax=Eiseniibacteriota bacterium TaxID=2212470 RepID=A0A948S106_UNCEI|nr:isoleucine--tRNA ligase [Candidatus Eisenbacteria bacterium]MBU1947439.1 isoleucine--tRNA ligase [Candidatus Eisenbacteria bacterium]MBU2693317.1 isoleucine--tRNA ligase [Candidatus Eisenbacteria bacterium]
MTGRFRAVDPKIDFVKLEHKVLEIWKDKDFFRRLVERNESGPRWSFIDGPVTANNPMGVHHAWGRTYKDAIQRYMAMRGYHQRYQNGFDCQGLWLEVETERELGFKNKSDIENFGLDKFSRACRARVEKFSGVWTEQSIRLGQWMHWDDSYYTMSDTNNASIWHFLKTCHEKGWLYQGHHSMPWCVRCGTSLSQHELTDTYQDIKDTTVTLRFPLTDGDSAGASAAHPEYLLVWTTTPWTLTSNVAAAVHPELDYAKVQYESGLYYVSTGALETVFEGKEYKVTGSVKGKELLGRHYNGPFDDLPVVKGVEHKVIPWDAVSDEDGTGIVHIAPGCGAEDFDLGIEFGLARLEPLDGAGNYIDGFGWLTGMNVFEVEKQILDDLKEKGVLFSSGKYTHRYPFCWRCKEKLVFRVEGEWFIGCDEIRPVMKEEALKVEWIPESIGKRTQDWYDNMGDWCISRKRYWGLPLPFYVCPKGHVTVVGSVEELRELAVDKKLVDNLPELHRPWIDAIKIRCQGGSVPPKPAYSEKLQAQEHCDEIATRINDVGDCWLDAGIVGFSTLKYFEDRPYWEKWFPAEVVIEMREQVRLWFYAMMFSSVTLEGCSPYKKVFAYEKIHDEKGAPMHKSHGNAIWFDVAVEEMGADVMRWLYCAANPNQILRFGYTAANEVRRNLITLWNVYSFFITYAGIDGFNPAAAGAVELKAISDNGLDRWILSAYYALVAETRQRLEAYQFDNLMRASTTFIDNLSTWYIRRSRRRFWKSESDDDKGQAHRTLYHVLLGYVRLMAPIIPFLTDEIYGNLILPFRNGDGAAGHAAAIKMLDPSGESIPESVHLTGFPEERPDLVDEKLNEQMKVVLDVVSLARFVREKAKVKVRQPMRRIRILPRESDVPELSIELKQQIAEELNVKEVVWGAGAIGAAAPAATSPDDIKEFAAPSVKLDFRTLGAKVGGEMKRLSGMVKKDLWTLSGEQLLVGENPSAPDFRLDPGEFSVTYEGNEGYAVAQDARFFVVFDLLLDPELIREGWAREVVRRVQDMRKTAGYHVADRITLDWSSISGADEVKQMMDEQSDYITNETLTERLNEASLSEKTDKSVDASSEVKLGETAEIWVGVKKSLPSMP